MTRFSQIFTWKLSSSPLADLLHGPPASCNNSGTSTPGIVFSHTFKVLRRPPLSLVSRDSISASFPPVGAVGTRGGEGFTSPVQVFSRGANILPAVVKEQKTHPPEPKQMRRITSPGLAIRYCSLSAHTLAHHRICRNHVLFQARCLVLTGADGLVLTGRRWARPNRGRCACADRRGRTRSNRRTALYGREPTRSLTPALTDWCLREPIQPASKALTRNWRCFSISCPIRARSTSLLSSITYPPKPIWMTSAQWGSSEVRDSTICRW